MRNGRQLDNKPFSLGYKQSSLSKIEILMIFVQSGSLNGNK